MNTNAYITFLLIGIVLVAVDGQIIYHSGRRYLENSYGAPEAGASMARLVAVMFHLAVLGILALLSLISFGGDESSIPSVVGKLGLLLLVLAAAHGITLAVLSRIRDEQVGENLVARKQGVTGDGRNSTVNPVSPGTADPTRPSVSPSLEHGAPYSAPGEGR
ncbi:hypothetical protein [Amycolatopsis minnesotensis]|uniref:Integral membrane protein n=1 Tax=Amycolatopsis minnesotensis TaxID=337894 RepID=A0ABP5C4J0_9PSEU